MLHVEIPFEWYGSARNSATFFSVSSVLVVLLASSCYYFKQKQSKTKTRKHQQMKRYSCFFHLLSCDLCFIFIRFERYTDVNIHQFKSPSKLNLNTQQFMHLASDHKRKKKLFFGMVIVGANDSIFKRIIRKKAEQCTNKQQCTHLSMTHFATKMNKLLHKNSHEK